MSQDQQKLNQQMQQMLNDMQGNRLSVDQQERLQQMARQQQAIKRQLEQLNREGGAQNQLMGDLERIAEQMEETIRELQQNQTDRRTVERQQQILTRLLNAQKSLQQQGREEQREGRQSDETFDRESPGELTREEQIDRLRRDLIRALETGYAPDYEELIKRYFELLQEQE
jgi:chromosome segregation ATPase